MLSFGPPADMISGATNRRIADHVDGKIESPLNSLEGLTKPDAPPRPIEESLFEFLSGSSIYITFVSGDMANA